MAEKTYTSSFSPDQQVFHVSLTHGIRKGVIDKIQVIDDVTTQFIYFVLFDVNLNATPILSDLYSTLGSAQAGSLGGGALERYELLLTTP